MTSAQCPVSGTIFSSWFLIGCSASRHQICTFYSGPSVEPHELIFQMVPTALTATVNAGSHSEATQSAFNFVGLQHQVRVHFYLCQGCRWGQSSMAAQCSGSFSGSHNLPQSAAALTATGTRAGKKLFSDLHNSKDNLRKCLNNIPH